MPYLVKLTPAQVAAIAAWTHASDTADDVKIDDAGTDSPGTVYVGQGNARIYVAPDGKITETRRAS